MRNLSRTGGWSDSPVITWVFWMAMVVLFVLASVSSAQAQDPPKWRLLPGGSTDNPDVALFYAPSTLLRDRSAVGLLLLKVRVGADDAVSSTSFGFAVDCDTGVYIVSDRTGQTEPEVATPGSLAGRLRTLLCSTSTGGTRA